MNATTFKREANYLFSSSYQNSLQCDYPDTVSSRKLANKFRAFLKSQFKDCEVEVHDVFCGPSAFVSRNNKYVYISIDDVRHWRNWSEDILVRTAKNNKDYTGGPNRYTTLSKIQDAVYKLLES